MLVCLFLALQVEFDFFVFNLVYFIGQNVKDFKGLNLLVVSLEISSDLARFRLKKGSLRIVTQLLAQASDVMPLLGEDSVVGEQRHVGSESIFLNDDLVNETHLLFLLVACNVFSNRLKVGLTKTFTFALANGQLETRDIREELRVFYFA